LSSCWGAPVTGCGFGGIDMLDGTPIIDIKPYLSNVPDDQLRRGWLDEVEGRRSSG
jgi:tRNA (Thr-GGU) A37 N-methylase